MLILSSVTIAIVTFDVCVCLVWRLRLSRVSFQIHYKDSASREQMRASFQICRTDGAASAIKFTCLAESWQKSTKSAQPVLAVQSLNEVHCRGKWPVSSLQRDFFVSTALQSYNLFKVRWWSSAGIGSLGWLLVVIGGKSGAKTCISHGILVTLRFSRSYSHSTKINKELFVFVLIYS